MGKFILSLITTALVVSTNISAVAVKFNGTSPKNGDVSVGSSATFLPSVVAPSCASGTACASTMTLRSTKAGGETLNFKAPGWQYQGPGDNTWYPMNNVAIKIASDQSYTYNLQCTSTPCGSIKLNVTKP